MVPLGCSRASSPSASWVRGRKPRPTHRAVPSPCRGAAGRDARARIHPGRRRSPEPPALPVPRPGSASPVRLRGPDCPCCGRDRRPVAISGHPGLRDLPETCHHALLGILRRVLCPGSASSRWRRGPPTQVSPSSAPTSIPSSRLASASRSASPRWPAPARPPPRPWSSPALTTRARGAASPSASLRRGTGRGTCGLGGGRGLPEDGHRGSRPCTGSGHGQEPRSRGEEAASHLPEDRRPC